MSLYLDYNASTPIDLRVLEKMISAYRDYYGNADSRTHDYGINARQAVEYARSQVASLLGTQKHEVVFTSGATESNNLAILGLADYGTETHKQHIVTTAIEHKAVLEPIKQLEKRGFSVDYIAPDDLGRVSADAVLAKIRPDTLLVSVMHVNNETGVIQPVQAIGQKLLDTDTLFHIDAAQSCGKLVNELKTLHCDLMSVTAHKMYGPQGIGALILRRHKNKKPPVRPIVFGGGHESGLRAGTLPIALIVGFGAACELVGKEHATNYTFYQNNKRMVIETLDASGVRYVINGDSNGLIANTLNISFVGVDSEALMIATKQYCSLSNGSACTSSDYNHSHVLTAMGLSDERIESALRISWGVAPINQVDLSNLLRVVGEQQ